MRALLTFLFSAIALPLLGATGDILWCSTTNFSGQPFYDSGAMLSVCIEGMATNGTADTGISYSTTAASDTRDLSHAKVVVSLLSQGFTTSGEPTTVERTLYGTLVGRFTYPSQTNQNIIAVGSDVVLSFWLSEPVYSGDSNITANISPGVYVANSVTNAAASGLTVTNFSKSLYPNTVANWVYPDRQRAVTSWTNRYIGFNSYAFNFTPVAKAYDVATDAHGNNVTNVAALTLSRDTKGYPIIEYQSVHYATNFTQGDIVTNNFYLLPWIGNTVADSSTITNCGSHYVLCDRSNVWNTVAVLALTNNGTGVATNFSRIADARAHPFTSIQSALTAIVNANKLLGRTNSSGATIYCQPGTYNFQPTRSGSHSGDDSWLTIMPDSGFTKSDVIFTNTGTLAGGPDTTYLCLKDVTLTQAASYYYFYALPNLWCDNIVFNGYTNGVGAGSAELFLSCPNNYLTCSTISNNYYHGRWSSKLTRGSYLDNLYRIQSGGVMIGNFYQSNPADASDLMVAAPSSENWILENCYFSGGRLLAGTGGSSGLTNGFAFVQSVFEKLSGSAQPIFSFNDVTNALLMKLATVGDRCNLFYYADVSNPTASSGPSFDKVSMRDCLLSGIANKNDGFTGLGLGKGGTNQYGNWTFSNGVGCSGNYYRQWTGTANSFALEFMGVNCLAAYSTSDSVSNVLWVSPASQFDGDSGNGNYRLQSASPVFRLAPTWNGLPWDIEGNNRSSIDPAGPYAAGNAKKGGMFFP